MGAGASVTGVKLEDLSAHDIAREVAAMGQAYTEYAALLIENAVDGHLLSTLSESELISALEDLGITKKLHQKALNTKLLKIKNHGLETAALALKEKEEGELHPATEEIKFELGDRITMSPREIMQKLFQIQGIRLYPNDVELAANKVFKVVGRSKSDGITTYDCFLNYRVAADADIAEKLYYILKANGVHAFLDKKCLQDGMDWKTGFIQGWFQKLSVSCILVGFVRGTKPKPYTHSFNHHTLYTFSSLFLLSISFERFNTGLKRSRVFVALISSAALSRVRDTTQDHTFDNVLLEYQTALKVVIIINNANTMVI